MGRHKIISDEELIRGARKCFLKHGPQVSTTVIAKYVGISQAAVFKRFSTKEALMVAALSPPAHPPWLEVLKAKLDDRDLRDQLTEIVSLLNHHAENVVPAIAILRASGLNPEKMFGKRNEPPPVRIVRHLSSWFKRAQKKGLVRKFNTDSLAHMLIGAVFHRHFLVHTLGPGASQVGSLKHQKNVVEAFIQGIGTEEAQ